MKIGFDGKRAFQNKTGLGNYSRSLITSLAKTYPQHFYSLFTPTKTDLFDIKNLQNIQVNTPQKFIDKKFSSLWRRSRIVNDIKNNGIDIYHGLSNELPAGIEKIAVKTVISVHDLIFERYPDTYHFDEKFTHRWKMKNSCKIADAVIATSQQTKKDLIEFYKIAEEKIFVCYQNCNPIFENKIEDADKAIVKKRYQLPDQYFLFVSSITQRKNLIAVCKALLVLKDKCNIPLVVIGDGKKEKEEVIQFLKTNQLQHRVYFLNNLPQSKEPGFVTSADFPAIYQQAFALIYPSYFEGFGIPLLEAMWSGLPVISSSSSCLPEVAGDAALYFSPDNIEALAGQMLQISLDKNLVENLQQKGFLQAQKFTALQHAQQVMQVYENLFTKL